MGEGGVEEEAVMVVVGGRNEEKETKECRDGKRRKMEVRMRLARGMSREVKNEAVDGGSSGKKS